MKNFRQLSCFIFLFLILFQSSCKAETDKPSANSMADLDNCQRGFIEGFGSSVTQSPEGYYIKVKNYLMFFEPDMKSYTFVCNRPDCLHNKESMETAANCNAYFGGSELVQYYDGNLYVSGYSTTELHANSIYKVSPDGSTKTAIFNSPKFSLTGFTIHQGYAYVYEKKYPEDETLPPVLTITSFPLDHPDRQEILFSYDETKEAEINRIVCKDNFLYFILFDISSGHMIFQPYQINLKTKELSVLFKYPDNIAKNFDDIITTNYFLAPDQIISCVLDIKNTEQIPPPTTHYRFHMDGSFDQHLTENDYEQLNQSTYIAGTDDQYIYITEQMTTKNGAIQPLKDPVIYVYEADGTLAGMVDTSKLNPIYTILPGNTDFFLIKETPAEGAEFVYYRVDKNQLNKNSIIQPREIIQVTLEFSTAAALTFE